MRFHQYVRRASLLLLVATLPLGRAAAAEPEPEPPTKLWLVAGTALAGSGVFLQYQGSQAYRDPERNCSEATKGCYWLANGGSIVTIGGGAAFTAYAWKSGAYDKRRDLIAGTVKNRKNLATSGLVIGGTGLVARIVVQVYLAFKILDQCVAAKHESQIGGCGNDALGDLLVADALLTLPLFAGAAMAGYGFGYENTTRPVAPVIRITPTPSRSGAGLTIAGSF